MSNEVKKSGLLDRLLKNIKINDTTDCWEWQASLNNVGYGLMRDGRKMRTTHRVSYEQHKGPIPDGLIVCHECDNPKCVNPDHLWLGTRKDNTADMYKKGRARPGGSGWFQPKITCVHCNIECGVNTHARWHGDNCKMNVPNNNTP